MIGTSNGSSVLLECQVEAFPPPLIYWIQGENRRISTNTKYKVFERDLAPFTNFITLNITYVDPTDYGLYKCVAKNERGTTSGLLTLYGEFTFFFFFFLIFFFFSPSLLAIFYASLLTTPRDSNETVK